MTPPTPPSRQAEDDPQLRIANALESIRLRLNIVIALIAILLIVIVIAMARASALTSQFQ